MARELDLAHGVFLAKMHSELLLITFLFYLTYVHLIEG